MQLSGTEITELLNKLLDSSDSTLEILFSNLDDDNYEQLNSRLEELPLTDGESDRKYAALEQKLKYYFTNKFLSEYLQMDRQEAYYFIHDHPRELGSSICYDLFQEFKLKYGDNPENNEFIIDREHLLAYCATQQLLSNGQWEAAQSILRNSYKWFSLEEGPDSVFENALHAQPEAEVYLRHQQNLMLMTRKEGPEIAIEKQNLNFLMREINESENYDKIDKLFQARELAQIIGHEHTIAAICANLGDALFYSKGSAHNRLLSESVQYYQSALNYFSFEQYPKEWAAIQVKLGKAYEERQSDTPIADSRKSIIFSNNALTYFTRKAFPEEWAKIQIDLGLAYFKFADQDYAEHIENAIDCFNLAKTVLTAEEYPEDWAMIQSNLANVFGERIHGNKAQNVEEEIIALQSLKDIYTYEQLPEDWAMTMHNLGNAYSERIKGDRSENIDKAIYYYKEALSVYTKDSDPLNWAKVLHNLGTISRHRGKGNWRVNLEASKTIILGALEVRTKDQYPILWAFSNNTLGNILIEEIKSGLTDHIEPAITAYRNALLIYDKENFPDKWAMATLNLALTFLEDQSESRPDSIDESIRLLHEVSGIYSNDRHPLDWALVQSGLGSAYFQRDRYHPGDKDLAIQYFMGALEIWTLQEFPSEHRKVARNLGTLYVQDRNWELVQSHFTAAHNAITILRENSLNAENRSVIARENNEIYQWLIQSSLELKDYDSFFRYAMAAKSRTITEQMAQEETVAQAIKKYPEINERYNPIAELQNQLQEQLQIHKEGLSNNSLSSKPDISGSTEGIKDLRDRIARLTDNLVFDYPYLAAIKSLPILTLDNARKLSKDLNNTPLVEFVRHARGWTICLVIGEDFIVRELPTNLSDLLHNTINEIISNEFWIKSNYPDSLREAYDLLIKPIESLLPTDGRLVIAPAGGLHLIPFNALSDENMVYLSEKYAINIVPSLTALYVLHERSKRKAASRESSESLLSVAYSGTGEDYLPNVLTEVKAITPYFDQTESLLEDDAIAEEVIDRANKSSFDVIHFSCHAGYNMMEPSRSGLELKDRALTVEEIQRNLRLTGGPMITLSACQTGIIKPELGDESTGLAWAFLASGASCVLSSQWSVDDTATRYLFETFYKIRSISSADEAELLKLAMDHVRKSKGFENPLFWAAFQVTGIPDRANRNIGEH